MLPKDNAILLSLMNTKLRDTYKSLADMCDDLEYNKEEIETRLSSIGYTYNLELNKFV